MKTGYILKLMALDDNGKRFWKVWDRKRQGKDINKLIEFAENHTEEYKKHFGIAWKIVDRSTGQTVKKFMTQKWYQIQPE